MEINKTNIDKELENRKYRLALLNMLEDMKEDSEKVKKAEQEIKTIFENAPVSLWEEDFSDIKKYIDKLKQKGIKDFKSYFEKYPKEVLKLASMVKVVNINSTTLKLFDAKSKGDFIKGIANIFTPSSIEIFKNEIIAFASGETLYKSEGSVKTLKGKEFQMSITVAIPEGFENSWEKIFVSITDISKEKQAEQKYKIIMENSPDPIALIDLKGNIIDINKASEEISGYTKEELLSMNIANLHAKDQLGKAKKLFESVIKTGKGKYEINLLGKDKKEMPTILSSALIKLARKDYILTIVKDISNIRKAEKEKEDLSIFLSENPNPVFRISKGGYLIYSNKAGLPFLKQEKMQLGEKLPLKWYNLVKKIYASEKPREIEYVLASGKKFLFSVNPLIKEGYSNVYGREIVKEKHFSQTKAPKKEQPNSEMALIYSQEANKALQNIKSAFEELKTDPNNQKKIFKLYRAAHTLKSSSFQMGYYPVGYVASLVCDMLREVKVKKIIITPEKLAFLEDFIGSLEKSINHALKGKEFEVDKEFFEKINKIMEGSVKAKLKKDEEMIRKRINKIRK